MVPQGGSLAKSLLTAGWGGGEGGVGWGGVGSAGGGGWKGRGCTLCTPRIRLGGVSHIRLWSQLSSAAKNHIIVFCTTCVGAFNTARFTLIL